MWAKERMKQVKISQVDVLLSHRIYLIEFLFYFKESLDTEKIRKALKKLAPAFWPLFGEYKDGIISFEKYDEKEFYDEEFADQEFQIPPTEEEKWRIYSPYSLQDTKKLFRLKVTHLKNGTILVPKMKHIAGDGYSYFYFLSSLAALSQHTLLPTKSSVMQLFLKPHHRRKILKDFSFEGIEEKILKQNTQFTMGIDEVCRQDVNLLIRNAAESKNFRISTNDVLSAMAIQKLIGTQKEFAGEFIEFTVPIDVRRNIKEYGRKFFGNGIMLHKMMLKRENIQTSSTVEIAVQIRKSMPSVSKSSYLEYLIGLEKLIAEGDAEKLRPFDPQSGCLVTNISRLPIDRLNFGSGPPDLIFPFTIEKNAAAVLAKDENFILRYAF
jgi:NRPS condensation-like uncharacterized protein